MNLPITEIRTDGGTQPRAQLDMMVVAEYADEMQAGNRFPAVIVFYDGSDYWLADGYHRLWAARQTGLEAIDADVRQGTVDDARWFSYAANQSHGLRRSNEDKRRAVEAALQHPKAGGLSDNQIAHHCGVSQPFVSKLRLSYNNYKMDARTVTRNGTTYEMSTANIGKPSPATTFANDVQLLPTQQPTPELSRPAYTVNVVGNLTEEMAQYEPQRPMKPKSNQAGDIYTAKGYDACQTPPDALAPLLPFINPRWTVWEPAHGEGNITNMLCNNGLSVVSSDIITGQNFFEYQPAAWDCLITNPPYSIKYEWLKRCYELGKPFALLMPVEMLGTVTGGTMFQEYGIEMIFIAPRVNFKMPHQGWDGGGAQFPTAWFCWGMNLGQQMNFVISSKG